MPMMLMGGLEGEGVDKIMSFLLMTQMNGGGDSSAMSGMMQAMMMAQLFKSGDSGKGTNLLSGGFKKNNSPF